MLVGARSEYNASNLPNGLTLDANTGIISGTINSTGNFYVTITGTDDDGIVSDTFAISVIDDNNIITGQENSILLL